ncbi:hypothetical protein [Ruegeria sp. HKCCD8929]|uniref:hypothetical protein n=1 Tax=Ruegeria sp. HKCCD8929 TaxID=2683006 RepID=UPI00148864E0|nr:hypothetical protein [Ruegeria sp. HKCCD8929]
MTFHVHTLVHTRSGRFLIFRRPILTYFQATKGGQIFPDGQKLYCGGRYSLPNAEIEIDGTDTDAWLNDRLIIEAGRKIFIDTCGALIEFLPPSIAVHGPVFVNSEHEINLTPAREAVIRFRDEDKHYAGYFVEVEDEDLDRIRTYLLHVHAEARAAMLAVIQDDLYDYEEMRDRYPHAPFDNVHAGVDIWHLDIERLEINGLKSSKTTKWILEVITALELMLAAEDV